MLTADPNRSHPHHPPTARRPSRAAFTLIELMVVIGIIILLVGISVYAYTQVTRHSKAQKTKAALEVCRALLAEYEATAGPEAYQALVDKPPNLPIDVSPNITPPYDFDNATRIVMQELLKAPNAKQIMGRLPPESVKFGLIKFTSTSMPLILDGYGRPIAYIPAGGMVNLVVAGALHPDALQSDGRFHLGSGPKTRRAPYWASMGPDGKMYEGDDNQYSFEN